MKVNKYLIVTLILICLCFVCMLIPSTIHGKKSFTFLYNYATTKKILIQDTIYLADNIKLKLKKAPKPYLFLYQGLAQAGKAMIITINIIDNYGSPEPSISQKSQSVTIEWHIATTLFEKCIQLLNGKKVITPFLNKCTGWAVDATLLYGLDATRQSLRDSIGYTKVISIDSNIEPKEYFNIIVNTFQKIQRIAEQYQAFPGNFSMHLAKDNLMYSWMTNVVYPKLDYLYPVRIPSGGYLYTTKQMSSSYDSLYYLQSQVVELARARGFTQVAVPFMKVYKIDEKKRRLSVQFFTPIF